MNPKRPCMVTGSRNTCRALRRQVFEALDLEDPDFLIVGCCPTGADKYARMWARQNGVLFRKHRADWRAFGLSAGPLRNTRMVDHAVEIGARVCAFPRGGRGTADCMRKAYAARLTVVEWR